MNRIAFALIAGLVALGVVAGIGLGIRSALHTETMTCTVTGKDRVYDMSSKSREQRVYTEECGTLKVGDSLFDGHFDSADTWGQIEEGHTYEMKTRGLRVGFFSMFPNIVELEEVK